MTTQHHPPGISRRGFLGAAAALPLIGQTTEAAAPIHRGHGAHMKLSLAAYSFNKQLPRRAAPDAFAQAEMRLADFIDYCASLTLDGCELTSYYFPAEVTQEYLMQMKQQSFRLGLDISGTAIGNDFCVADPERLEQELAMTREWIDYAALMGAPVIRIFAGKVPEGDTEDAAVARCIAAIDQSLDYAAKKGVFLALENHGGITATPEQLLRIVHGVQDSPWFGINFDSGNFATADPYGDLEKIAPYTINAQIKVMMRPGGGEKVPSDIPRTVRILRDAGYRGYVVLEYEEDDARRDIPRYIDALRAALA